MPGLEFSLVWLPWATKPLCPSCALPLTLHPNVCPSHPQLPFDFFLKQGDGLIHPYNSQRSWSTNAACQAWGKDDSTYELAMAFFTFLLFSFSRVRPTRVVVDTWEAILFDRVPLCSAVKAPGVLEVLQCTADPQNACPPCTSRCPAGHPLCEMLICNYLHLEENSILHIKLFRPALTNAEFSRITTARGTNFALFEMLPWVIPHFRKLWQQ